jgi:hypothetical protein
MKVELLIFGLTAFFVVNTYYDGKYVQIVKSWKKYYQMTAIGFAGLSAYLFLKKYPTHSRSLLSHASGIVKYMPIDKDAGDMLTPLLNMSKSNIFGGVGTATTNDNTGSNINNSYAQGGVQYLSPQQQRMLDSGKKGTKRCVSETKKKYVASQQGWKCGDCKEQLPAWFEVDHKIRLDSGGSNHIDNLVALCRDCHGRKTAMENL